MILPERIPTFDYKKLKRKEEFTGFKLHHYIRFISLKKVNDPTSLIKKTINEFRNDNDRYKIWIQGVFLSQISPVYMNDMSYLFRYSGNKWISKIDGMIVNNSAILANYKLTQNRRYICEEEKIEKHIAADYEVEADKKLIKNIVSKEGCKYVVEFLKKIPNFGINLTEEESSLIEREGNVLAIGRSGTGKTTCALLKMFSAEILYKWQIKKTNSQLYPENKPFSSLDIENIKGLHSIFVTASPVLTMEVSRYYEKLSSKLRNELNAAQKKEEEQPKEEKKEEKEEKKQNEKDEKDVNIEKEINMLDEMEVEEKINLPNSLAELKPDSFPLFLTIRRLLMMIDASCARPFFARNPQGQLIGRSEGGEWHNENSGVMMINSYYKIESKIDDAINKKLEDKDMESLLKMQDMENDEEAEDDENVYKNQKANNAAKITAQECTYEVFLQKFWPKYSHLYVQRAKNITPAIVWKEIFSSLKGAVLSVVYYYHYLPLEEYLNSYSHISIETKKVIYEIFLDYKRWIESNGYYDYCDFVTSILHQVWWNRYTGPVIHFIMCDEVQDLNPITLLLLLTLTEYNIFFSGDTAQTIVEGINFRFQDLKAMFNKCPRNHLLPYIQPLTVNFRSHSKILNLANSVICILETYFPKSIDKLEKETSKIDGPKPIVILGGGTDMLFNILSLTSKNASQSLKARLEFGSNQVIILRNQESKAKIPSILKHALCLTVYEAKGLEFDDVIIYNFFTDSKCKDDYSLLSKGSMPTTKSYADLCLEMKHLYTAITRARSSLIIYDDSPEDISDILTIWKKDDLVYTIQKEEFEIIEKASQQNYSVISRLKDADHSIDGWLLQGVKMYRRKYFEQAALCFNKANRPDLHDRSIAFFNASRASEIVAEKECLLNQLTEGLQKAQKVLINENIESLTKEMLDKFTIAANLFISLKLYKEAGKCLFSLKRYSEAAKYFIDSNCYAQAGEAYMELKDYVNAAKYYAMGNVPSNSLKALSMLSTYEEIVEFISINYASFSNESKKSIVKEYLPKVLEKIFMEREKPQEQKNNTFEEIKENVEENLELLESSNIANPFDNSAIKEINKAESTTEKKVEAGKENNQSKFEIIVDAKNNEIKNPFEDSVEIVNKSNITEEESKENKKEQNESKKQETTKVQDKAVKNPFDSFDNVDEEDLVESFSSNSEKDNVLNAKVVNSINKNYLEQIDPDEEFSQCDGESIVDSIIKGNIVVSEYNSYSAVDNPQSEAFCLNVVKTKRDIFAEDKMMSDAFKFILLFQHEIKEIHKEWRSISATAEAIDSKNYNMESNWIIDLDQINGDMVNILLDELEYWSLYRGCSLVCNRYQLNERIGRYLASICYRYCPTLTFNCSTLQIMNCNCEEHILAQSVISSQAVHNFLEMIDPSYLKLKGPNDKINNTNSLSWFCYRNMLLMGYWKKLIYISDVKTSLDIASAFLDYDSYKKIYQLYYSNSNYIANAKFWWLNCEKVSKDFELNAALFMCNALNYRLNSVKQINYSLIPNEESKNLISEFPAQFALCKSFWEAIVNKNAMVDVFYNASKIMLQLEQSKAYEPIIAYDAYYAFTNILSYCIKYPQDTSNIINDSTLSQVSTILNAYGVFTKIVQSKSFKSLDFISIALKAIYSSLGIHMITTKELILPHFEKYIVSRKSYCFDYIMQKQHTEELERTNSIRNEAIEKANKESINVNLMKEYIEKLVSKNQKDKEAIFLHYNCPLLIDSEGKFIFSEVFNYLTQYLRNSVHVIQKFAMGHIRYIHSEEAQYIDEVLSNPYKMIHESSVFLTLIIKLKELNSELKLKLENEVGDSIDAYNDILKFYEDKRKENEEKKKQKKLKLLGKTVKDKKFTFNQTISALLNDIEICSLLDMADSKIRSPLLVNKIMLHISNALKSVRLGEPSNIFGLLASLISTGNYFMLLEILRTLNKEGINNKQIRILVDKTWLLLSASLFYKHNCYEDCYYCYSDFIKNNTLISSSHLVLILAHMASLAIIFSKPITTELTISTHMMPFIKRYSKYPKLSTTNDFVLESIKQSIKIKEITKTNQEDASTSLLLDSIIITLLFNSTPTWIKQNDIPGMLEESSFIFANRMKTIELMGTSLHEIKEAKTFTSFHTLIAFVPSTITMDPSIKQMKSKVDEETDQETIILAKRLQTIIRLKKSFVLNYKAKPSVFNSNLMMKLLTEYKDVDRAKLAKAVRQNEEFALISNKIKDSFNIVYNMFNRSPLANSFDAAYLFMQIEQIHQIAVQMSSQFDTRTYTLNFNAAGELRERIDNLIADVLSWRNKTYIPNMKEVSLQCKKIRAKWSEKITHIRQKQISKQTEIKRQERLQFKRLRLKKKEALFAQMVADSKKNKI